MPEPPHPPAHRTLTLVAAVAAAALLVLAPDGHWNANVVVTAVADG